MAASLIKSETWMTSLLRSFWSKFLTPPEMMIALGFCWGLVDFVVSAFGEQKAVPRKKTASSEKKAQKVSKQPTVLKFKNIALLAVYATSLLASTQIQQLSRAFPQVDVPKFLAREYSSSGYISVVEHQVESGHIRVLRSDHSIIGGIFIDEEFHGNCIYGAFYFLSFVADIERKGRLASKKALNIGLGVGIASAELVKRKIHVDVVELDPAVIRFAQSHFNLKDVANYYIQDGRKYLEEAKSSTYDFVLHDVFSNGFVPVTLFSIEAMNQIKRVLTSSGILALNFVGKTDSIATLSVYKTISSAFKYVRVFIENGVEEMHTINNIVFFASESPINFKPIPSNGLVVHDMMATRFPNFEIHLNLTTSLTPVIMTDTSNVLSYTQKESQEKHWDLMTELFGYEFWLAF
ncbi:hypothetical protein HDU67_009121 [Dinochytrium kinnereticum]|nr:hypothetical protein HDU67_009121 [Dinochytrium kinnereticum]